MTAPLNSRLAKLEARAATRTRPNLRVFVLDEHEPAPVDPNDPGVLIVRLVRPEARL